MSDELANEIDLLVEHWLEHRCDKCVWEEPMYPAKQFPEIFEFLKERREEDKREADYIDWLSKLKNHELVDWKCKHCGREFKDGLVYGKNFIENWTCEDPLSVAIHQMPRVPWAKGGWRGSPKGDTEE